MAHENTSTYASNTDSGHNDANNEDQNEDVDIDTSTKYFDDIDEGAHVAPLAATGSISRSAADTTAAIVGSSNVSATSTTIHSLQEQLRQAKESFEFVVMEREELRRQSKNCQIEAARATARANDYKIALSASRKREQLLSAQVKQLTLFNDLPRDRIVAARQETGQISARLGQGQSLGAVNEEVEMALRAQGLGSDQFDALDNPFKGVLRTAQVAAALVDPSGGKLLQHWASSGEDAGTRLGRFAQRIQEAGYTDDQLPQAQLPLQPPNSYQRIGTDNSFDNNVSSLGSYLQASGSQQPSQFHNEYDVKSSGEYNQNAHGGGYENFENGGPSVLTLSQSPPSGSSSSMSPALSRFQGAGKKVKNYMTATKASTRRRDNGSTPTANMEQ